MVKITSPIGKGNKVVLPSAHAVKIGKPVKFPAGKALRRGV